MVTGAQRQRGGVKHRLRARKRADVAPPGYVTTQGLKEKLGLKDSEIRTLRRGDPPTIVADGENAGGYAIYSMKTVERLLNMKADGTLFRRAHESAQTGDSAAHYSSEQGVTVFELLSAGKTMEEIILKTKIHPMVVKRIRADHSEITGSILLPRRVVDRLNTFTGLPGSFPLTDANAVLEVFEQYAENRACTACGERYASTYCEPCLRSGRREEQELVVDQEGFEVPPTSAPVYGASPRSGRERGGSLAEPAKRAPRG